jgi:hypothetical protein
MEGSYIPGKQRKQLAQQGRKSHFSFGKTSHGYATTQTCFYRPNSSSSSPVRQANSRTASHFTLGSDSPQKRSEFGVHYKEHQIEPGKPKPKIVDLTPTSFVMGMQEIRFQTTSSFYKDPGSQGETRRQSHSPVKNRRHNFELGFDAPVKSSVMQKDFGQFRAETVRPVEKNLLESHVKMGGHPAMYRTVAENEFYKRDSSPGRLPPGKAEDLKKEHFVLGQDSPGKVSVQSTSYKPFLTPKQGLTKEQLNYLKNSHFKFQSENPDYVSVMKASIGYSPAEIREQEKYLKVNHVNFGDDQTKFKTNYSTNHYYRSQSVNQPVRTKNDEMRSDVILGVTDGPFESSTHSVLTGEKGIPGRMDPQLEKNLRGHHYSMGNSSNIYAQGHKNYGDGVPNPSKFLDGLKEDMLNTHWVSGFHKENLNSSMKREYRHASSERRSGEDYLKKHNHTLGDGQNNWHTSYNGGFKWIQPVPDKLTKFSFE